MGHFPIPFDGDHRHAKRFGHFLHLEAAVNAQFHDAGGARIGAGRREIKIPYVLVLARLSEVDEL